MIFSFALFLLGVKPELCLSHFSFVREGGNLKMLPKSIVKFSFETVFLFPQVLP